MKNYYSPNSWAIEAINRTWRENEKKRKARAEEDYKERCKIKTHKRRVLESNSSGSYTRDEWETVKFLFNFICPSCKKSEPEIKLTIDHIIPLSKGGSNMIENIQPLCKKCNSSKGTKEVKYGRI